MIGMMATIQDQLLQQLGPDAPRVKDAKFRNFGHAAASIRKHARQSIKRAPAEDRSRAKRRKGKIVRRARHAASPEGTPPFTGRGALRNAIFFHADDSGAIIGPAASRVGDVGMAHEFGGEYKGADFPERPFMMPALEAQAARFAATWEGSIG